MSAEVEAKLKNATRAYLIAEVARMRDLYASQSQQITMLQATIADLRKPKPPLLELADCFYRVSSECKAQGDKYHIFSAF